MRDKKRGDAQFTVQFLNLQACARAQLGVQVRERFVEQKYLRLAHDGAAHGHTLALATREFAWLAVQQRAQLQDVGGLVDPRINLVLGQLGDFQTIGHVVVHAHVRIQGVVLKDHGDVTLGGLQRIDQTATDVHFAFGDVFEPRHHAQQSALAAAAGAHDDDEFTVCNLHVHAVDDLHRLGP